MMNKFKKFLVKIIKNILDKLEEDEDYIPCMDCLCRTCSHNVCAEGDTCEGCNNCNGIDIVDTEDDCPRNMYEYMGD